MHKVTQLQLWRLWCMLTCVCLNKRYFPQSLFDLTESNNIKWRPNGEDSFPTAELLHMSVKTVAKWRERCCGCSAARALQYVQHVSRGLPWHPHTSAFWMDSQGQAAPLSVQTGLLSQPALFNKWDPMLIPSMYFSSPGVSPVGLYLCTALRCYIVNWRLKLTKLQHYSPNINSRQV